MKVQKFFTLAMVIACISCNENTEEISKRSTVRVLQADDAQEEQTSSSPDTTVVNDEVESFSQINLSSVSNLDLFEDFSNISLISKIDADTIVLFINNGFSWNYNSTGGLEANLPRLNPSEFPDSTIFSLPNDDFWLVGPTTVSKRKFVEDEAENETVLLNFDLSKLTGSRDSTRVLGITKESLILEMGSYVAIFSVVDGVGSAYEVEIQIPFENSGTIVSSGQTSDRGFWFHTSENKFIFLKRDNLKWVWSLVELPVSDVGASIKSVAAWLDVDSKSASGDVAVLTPSSFFSKSGAPLIVETN